MFEFVFNLIFFSFKRRLASLYDESPSTINTNKMCEDKNNKEIKRSWFLMKIRLTVGLVKSVNNNYLKTRLQM